MSYGNGTPDRRLIERFKCGDREGSFRALLERHHPMVYRYLDSMLRDPHEAEEAAQDVFARVSTALMRYEVRPNRPFESWLLRIVHNVGLRRIEQREAVELRQVAAVGAYRHQAGVAEDAATIFERETTRRELGYLLRELRPEQREAVVLTEVLSLESAEAGRLMNTTAANVRQLKRRGLKQLRADGRAVELRREQNWMRRRMGPLPVLAARRFALGAPGGAGGRSAWMG